MQVHFRTKLVHALIRSGYVSLSPCYVEEAPRRHVDSYQLLKAFETPEYFCDDVNDPILIISDEGLRIIDRYLEDSNVSLFPDPLATIFSNQKKSS